MGAVAANLRIVRRAVTRHPKMLRDPPMAGLVKQRYGIVADCGCRLRADRIGQAFN